MKVIKRKGYIFHIEKVNEVDNEKTYQIYDEKQEQLPFRITDDGKMIALYHNKKYVYSTYSQEKNKWRMIDNIIKRL